jgi:malate synthase
MTPSAGYTLPGGIDITADITPEYTEILTPRALDFVANLARQFEPRRQELLQQRQRVQEEITAGNMPGFNPDTLHVRESDWQVSPIPADLQDRRAEITGPVDRKMVINALNSGAKVFMADFEDAHSPTWTNTVDGQVNMYDAVRKTISLSTDAGKTYTLNDDIATLVVRPRGWHLNEKHMLVDGKPVSGALFDFGLYFYHNAAYLLEHGSGPYFYLPKLENHLEARLWNDVFNTAQDALKIPRGSIKATVLIETILAAFEMEEIIYELRNHMAGLNAGRWDYIFSIIKKFRNSPDFVFPDRAQITMTVPFMRAYTNLLVKTCHSRGAHAIGGMAAFIPSRRDADINEMAFAKVREDKEREATDGFDGTWVAHPDLVTIPNEVFGAILGDKHHQKHRLRQDAIVTADDLLNFTIKDGSISEGGFRANINIAIQYMEAWLRGFGAVGIYNLMEDAATAEISRSQLWQWVHSPKGVLKDGRDITLDLFRSTIPEELDKIQQLVGNDRFETGRYTTAAMMLDILVENDDFDEFLTLKAYDMLD